MEQTEAQQPLLQRQQSQDSPRRLDFTNSRKNKILVDYDPFRYPPDLAFARAHGRAHRTSRPVYHSEERCPCCHFPLQNDEIPFDSELEEMAHLGVAFPLYFDYTKLAFILLTAHLCLSALAGLILNGRGSVCRDLGNNSFICGWSVLNVLGANQLGSLNAQNILNIVFVFLSLVLTECFRVWQKRQKRLWRAGQVLPSEYSLMVKGLPADCSVREVEQLVEEELKLLKQASSIIRVYMLFDMKKFSDLYTRKAELHELLVDREASLRKGVARLLKEKNAKAIQQLNNDNEELRQEIKDCEQQLIEIDNFLIKFENAFNKGVAALQEEKTPQRTEGDVEVRFSGKAIVTLSSSEAARLLRRRWRMSWKQKSIMKGKWFSCLLDYKQVAEFKYKGNFLSVKRAAQPSDILWANVGSRKGLKSQTRVLAFICISLAMLIDFLILTLLKRFIKIEQGISQSSIWNLILSFTSSVICCGFNTLLGIIIRYFARNEIYNQKSIEFSSVCQRLTLVFMLNMVFATFFSNVVSFFLTSPTERATYPGFPLNFEGLVNDFFFLFITNSYMSSIFNYFDIVWGFRLIKRYRISEGLKQVSQAQANVTFEGHPVDMALRYANIKKTILFTGATAPLLPIGIPMSLLALLINYAVDKHLLLSRFVCPNRLNHKLSKNMVALLYYYTILFSVCNVLVQFIPVQVSSNGEFRFEEVFNNAYFYVALAAALFAIGYRLLPTQYTYRLVCYAYARWMPKPLNTRPYQEAKQNELLLEDYDDFTPYFQVRQPGEGEQGLDRRATGSAGEGLSLLDMVKGYLNSKKFNIDE